MKEAAEQNVLTPVFLTGVVVPQKAHFKLVTRGGTSYAIQTDPDWRRILAKYQWDEVRVRGLLNSETMTIVPQWVLPSGPTGETQRVSAASWLFKRLPSLSWAEGAV